MLAANELQSDVWINVPVTASSPTLCQTADGTVDKTIDPRKCIDGSEPGAATDPTKTYEYQLAELFFKGNEYTNYTGLDPKLNIYIEHSNEVCSHGIPVASFRLHFEYSHTRLSSPHTIVCRRVLL